MKQGIHPQYNAENVIACSTCGTKYEIGSTKNDINLAICAHCHPFYTGEQQVVIDTANKISSFNNRMDRANDLKKKLDDIKKQREERSKTKVGVIGENGPKLTLRDLLKANQEGKEKKKK
jgi:large subunit ribosomal protein L31